MALPALIPALKFLAPYAISLLGSRIGAGAQHGQQKWLEQLFSPESVGAEQNKFFDLFKSSPMYQMLRSRALQGSTSLANQLNASFARRGLNTSGIAAIQEPLARNSFQQGFQDIDAAGWAQALPQAMSSLQSKAAANKPSIGAGTWGGFLGDISPLLANYFKNNAGGWEGLMDIFDPQKNRNVPAPYMGQNITPKLMRPPFFED